MSTERRQYTVVRWASLLFAAAVIVLALGAMIRVGPSLRTHVLATSPCGCQAVILPISPIQRTLAWLTMVVTSTLLITFMVGLTRSFVRQARFHRKLESGFLRRLRHSNGATFSVFTSTQPQAFTLGFWRAKIYVSTALVQQLTKSEVAAVLQHEQAHQRSHDPLVATILDGLRKAWGWMPWIRTWVTAAASLRELTADAAATANYHRTEALAGAVTKLFDTSPVALAAFSPNASRVEKLLDRQWQPAWRLWRWQYLAGAVGMVVALVIIIHARPAKAENPMVVQRACHETQTMCRQVEQKALQAGLCLGADLGRCLNLPITFTSVHLIDASAAPLQP